MTARAREAILYGGTGQAKVVRAILEPQGIRVVAVVDDTAELAPPFDDVPLLLGLDGLRSWISRRDAGALGFCVAIGPPHGLIRVKIADELTALGLTELSAVHPSSVIDPSARIGRGFQAMAGAIVQPHAVIGRQCIVNTRASVDHECVLADGCDIGPAATLCGEVTVGRGAWIAAGATVLPRLTIGERAVVGAGSLVRARVEAHTTVVGVPASVLHRDRRLLK